MSIHPDRVLYRDDHLLIVNKLSGELVVEAGGPPFAQPSHRLRPAGKATCLSGRQAGGRGGKMPLFDFLKKTEPGLRVVHRLDYGTSGVIVFAKSAEAAKRIRDTKFAGWKKKYRALVAGTINKKEGTIKAQLKARTHEGLLVDAVTHYRVLGGLPIVTYVEAQIETGRKHQIRQHFQSIGHPLVMDPLYGEPKKDRSFRKAFPFRRFFLHAFSLDFPHPITGKAIHAEAPLPKPFEEVVKVLPHG